MRLVFIFPLISILHFQSKFVTSIMSHSETNPHFKPLQQPEGQPPSPGVTPPSPEVAPLQRWNQQNQPGSRGIRHQGERSKSQRSKGREPQGGGTLQRPRDRELQGDGTLQPSRKQSVPRQDLTPPDPRHGGGGYSTPWLFPQQPDEAHRVHNPQRGSKYHSPWIPLPQLQDEHPKQPDSAKVTSPQHQEEDHHPLHPRDPSLPPAHQENCPRQSSGLRTPAPQRTRPITWLAAAFCAIFWIVIFLGGLIVLIVYLVYRPRSPRFEVSNVSLNAVYVDAGSLLNADITLLANFTNPNKKVAVDFNHIIIDLYYGNTLIATQYIESFSTARAQSVFANVHMVTSQVLLPLGESAQLQEQSNKNGIIFNVKGVFRVRSNLGSFLRYSYRLYGHCTIMLTAPPSGVLRATRCRTKR
eukprot:XP_002530053.2 NDR1/HIN1-like protein 13 [Ricinus communis]